MIDATDILIPNILSATDYYPFGMPISDRKVNSADYRYGFNGKENDQESGTIDFGERAYDCRIAKFFSIDPRATTFPYWSPYQYAANNPIKLIDVNGESAGDPTNVATISAKLDDGKEAAKYQFTLYVLQPNRNTRDKFALPTEVGHTFIKITKINKDGTQVEVIFGYYPSSAGGIKAGSPLGPRSVPGTLNDDSGHKYDAAVSVEINKLYVDLVISTAQSFENGQYALCGKNCTNFGIQAAKVVGLDIPETESLIPVKIDFVPTGLIIKEKVKGANPADLGQDLLDGKYNPLADGATLDTTPGIATDNTGTILKPINLPAAGTYGTTPIIPK